MFNINNTSITLTKKGICNTPLFGEKDYLCTEVWKRNESNMNTDISTGEETMKSYTVEELLERAEDGRKQIAMGNYADIDDMFRELDEELNLTPYEN